MSPNKAYGLLEMVPAPDAGAGPWIAFEITPEIGEAIRRGQEIREPLGLRSVVLDLQCAAWTLDEDVILELRGAGYAAMFKCKNATWEAGKPEWVITDQDIKEAYGAVPPQVSGWGQYTFLSLEIGREGLVFRCHSPSLRSYIQTYEESLPRLLGTLAMYHDAPVGGGWIDIEVLPSNLVRTPERVPFCVTQDLVRTIERRTMSLCLAQGDQDAYVDIEGSYIFDFGMSDDVNEASEALRKAWIERAGEDFERADARRWLEPSCVRLRVYADSFQFSCKDVLSVDGASIETRRVQFADVPELQHLAPYEEPAPEPA